MSKGRKKEFDEKEVLAAMSRVFWEKGYEGASYEDLVKGTGVQRYGLYNSFGDKRAAFIHCLNYYVDHMVQDFTAPLRSKNADLSSIQDYFKMLLTAQTAPDAWGCFVCNTVSENISSNDEDVKAPMERMYKLVGECFKHALDNAQKKKQISQNLDTQIVANKLLGTMVGSAVMAKAPIAGSVIRDFVTSNLEQVGISAKNLT